MLAAQSGYAELAVAPAEAQLSPLQQVLQDTEQPEQRPWPVWLHVPAVQASQVPALPQASNVSGVWHFPAAEQQPLQLEALLQTQVPF